MKLSGLFEARDLNTRQLERQVSIDPGDSQGQAKLLGDYFRADRLTDAVQVLLDFDPEAGLNAARAILGAINMDDLPREVNEHLRDLVSQSLM